MKREGEKLLNQKRVQDGNPNLAIVTELERQTDTLQEILEKPEKDINIPEVIFPDVQKVKIINPTEIPEVVFPEVQKVEITNLPSEQKTKDIEPILRSILEALKDKKDFDNSDIIEAIKGIKPSEVSQLVQTTDLSPVLNALNVEREYGIKKDQYERLLDQLMHISNAFVNKASETTLQNVLTQLQAINTNTSNINVNIDTLEVNTDGVEDKLDTLNAKDFATSAKQDTGNTKLDTLHSDLTSQNLKLQEYKPQETDDYTTTSVTYVGMMKSDGTWLIKKLDETGNFLTIRFANVSNNGTLTSYSTAWSARTTATYNYLNVLTNL